MELMAEEVMPQVNRVIGVEHGGEGEHAVAHAEAHD